ncbi:MAG: L-threonine 3-dehydrogenase [Phycisphaerae bacterium]|nr:L-threonine 3-dehydrogenase [Phycisphaerae bacterium]NUQ09185.1 L-threonine 3-dehydrogenase [Phycisphaerae bacterium]
MSATMLAVRKMKPDRGLELQEVPRPRIGVEDVLVYVEAASICGTDLHIWQWDAWSQRRIKPPLTLGHEFAGTIVEVGEKVRSAAVGDFVSAESHVTCGICYQCRTGQAHMCPQTQILGVDRDGAFAHYVAVPEKVIWQNNREKIPPQIATLQEPFGNAVFATMGQQVSGLSVAVMGCGPIGLFTIGICKALGAKAVYATDLNPFRMNLARTMGATQVFDPSKDGDVVKSIVGVNHGYGVDLVLEMSGAPSAINAAFRVVRNGGQVTLFGIPSKPVEIDVAEMMIFKNLTVRALNGRQIFDTWYKTRWLLEDRIVNLQPLITRTVKLSEVSEAVQELQGGEACKIVVLPNDGKPAPLPAVRRERTPDPNIEGRVVHR